MNVKLPQSYLLFILSIAFLIGINLSSNAQSCANYAVTRSTGITYSSISSTGTSIPSWRRTTGSAANQQDDNRSYPIPIGFDYWYLGVRYTSVSVSINGFIDFSSSTVDGDAGAGGCGAIEYRENPNAFTCNTNGTYKALAILYDDIWVNGGGTSPLANSIKYQTTGSYPNRIFTVEFINMDSWTGGGGSGADLNFQVILYEGTGNIEYRYGTMSPGTGVYQYECGINAGTISAAPTAAQLLNQTVANTATFNNTPTQITALPTANTSLLFNPTTPTNPGASALTITGITQTSMTLNWPDWATGELGYVIYNSTDGVNYTFVTQLAANSTSQNFTSLFPSTTYYWKVHAVSEGQLSTPVTANATTLPKGPVKSLVTGPWSVPGTWIGGVVPTINDDVIISDGTIVTVDAASGSPGCDDLTIGEGSSGSLVMGNNATAMTLNIHGNVSVLANASFTSGTAGVATHKVLLRGNFTNNGTVDFSNATSVTNMYLNRNGNQTFSGAGATFDVNRIVMRMTVDSTGGKTIFSNFPTSNTLDITSTNFTAINDFLDIQSGIFKVSSAGSLTLVPYAATTTIVPAGGFYMNSTNSTVSFEGTLNYIGPITIAAGTVNVGNAADENLSCGGSSFTQTGGTLNVSGRFDQTNTVALTYFTQSGGTINLNTTGSTSTANAPFNMTVVGSTFNWSGGTMNIIREGGGGGNDLGFVCTCCANTNTVTASPILQIGTAATPATQTMRINSTSPIGNLVVFTTNSPIASLNTNTLTVKGYVDIQTGSSLLCNNLNLNVAGNFTNNGTFTPGTNTVTFNGTSTVLGASLSTFYNLTITGALTGHATNMGCTMNWVNNGTFTHNSGLVTFSAGNNHSISSTVNSAENFYNLTLAKSGGTLTMSGGSLNTINVVNDVIISTGGTDVLPATMNVSGNWTRNGGTVTPGTGVVNFIGTASKQINGTVATQNFNDVVINKSVGTGISFGGSTTTFGTDDFTETQGDFTVCATMNITGNWTHDAGTFTPGTGTINFIGNGNQVITSTSLPSETFYNVSITKTVAGTTLNVTGTLATVTTNNFSMNATNVSSVTCPSTLLDINGNATLSNGTLIAGNQINLFGNWTFNTAGTFTPGTSKFRIDGTAAQQMNGTKNPQTFYNIEVDKSNTLTRGGSLVTINCNNFTTIAGTVDLNAAGNTLNCDGDFYLAGGTYSAPGNTNVKGNWVFNGGTFTHNSRTVTFNGTAAQRILGDNATTFSTLVMNNTFATVPQITLDTLVNVATTLTLTDGVVKSTSTDYITMLNASSTTVGSAASYISGPMDYVMAVNNSTRTLNFPVGDDNNWRAMSLSVRHSAATSYTYRGEMVPSSAMALGYTIPATLSHVSYIRHYILDRYLTTTLGVTNNTNITTGANGPRITLYYGVDDDVTDIANLAVVKNSVATPTDWTDLSGVAAGTPSGSIQTPANSAGFTTFSRFALANKLAGTNGLPIELLYFNAAFNNNGDVDLNWKTATEYNNDYFTIERSRDGNSFENIGIVDGAGTSMIPLEYASVDFNPYEGISYYRLKQTDFNNEFTYSNIVSVQSGGTTGAVLYPNPNNGKSINIFLSNISGKSVTIKVYDCTGHLIADKVIAESTKDKDNVSLEFSENLAKGLYFTEIFDGTTKSTLKFVVQE